MLTPAAAAAAIAASLAPLGAEDCPLARAAGRVLLEDVHAERDAPPFDRVAMDGIAVGAAAWRAGRRAFRVAGTQAAGNPPRALPAPDACLEAMTGAVLPPGADLVVPVESLTIADGVATVDPAFVATAGANVHRRASDLAQGTRVLGAGTRLGAAEVAVLASAGRTSVRVARAPSLAVVSTGDELVEPGLPIADWQVRRSNVHGVAAALRLAGYADVIDDHVADDPAAIRATLARHLAGRDALVLSGGVSAGRYDHVPAVLADLGVERVFHKVAQRPGKPLWFGVSRDGRPVFALPGNPVSTLVCLQRYVLPALARLCGAAAPTPTALPLASPVRFRHGLTSFLPVRLVHAAEGATHAEPRPTNGSGDFHALVGTAGFVELAPERDWARGDCAPFYAWAA